MSEQGETSKRIVSLEESDFIRDNVDREKTKPLFVEGMLSTARKEGKTLEEVKKTAVGREESPEQDELWENAYRFLDENRERFGLTSKE